jgi:YhcH/YjgK/YiaL family protein
MSPVPEGTFMLLAPQDVHKPQIAIHAPQKVKKVVVKVKM